MSALNIGVIGAGAVGLSTAVNIQKEIPNCRVTIVAKDFGKDTTSFGAGGYFRPSFVEITQGRSSIPRSTVQQWVSDSWEFFNGLARSSAAKETGNNLTSGTIVAQKSQRENYEPFLEKSVLYDFHEISRDELKKRNLDSYKFGYSFTTVITQNYKFLPWLMRKFRESGGLVQNRKLSNLQELQGQFDIVVNCCGLGARKLVNDNEAFPVRGQLVMVKAPWMKHFFLSDDNIYLIPHDDKLIIGGTRDKNDWNEEINENISARILSRAKKLFPELEGAEVISNWVGLRPYRTDLRLEIEVINCGHKGTLPVVHNYGHGGHGITLSWGTAKHATRLVKQISMSNRPKL